MNLNSLVLSDSVCMVIVSIALALCLAGAVSFISGKIMPLPQNQQIQSFIIGFGLMSSLAVVQFAPLDGWRTRLLLCSLPTLLTFIYFLPTFLATIVDCEIFRGVFLVNLVFGWTGVGWIVALMMAFRRPERDIYNDVSIRLTPLGAVPRGARGYTAEERLRLSGPFDLPSD